MNLKCNSLINGIQDANRYVNTSAEENVVVVFFFSIDIKNSERKIGRQKCFDNGSTPCEAKQITSNFNALETKKKVEKM